MRWQKSQSGDNLYSVRQNIKSASFAWHIPQEHANLPSIFCRTGRFTLLILRWNWLCGSFSSISLLMARIEQEEQARLVSVTGALSAICWGIFEYRFAPSHLDSFSVSIRMSHFGHVHIFTIDSAAPSITIVSSLLIQSWSYCNGILLGSLPRYGLCSNYYSWLQYFWVLRV